MPENRPDDCQRFDDWLAEAAPEAEAGRWREHLGGCAHCRAQWLAHRALVAALAGEPMPELSPAFAAGLERKLEAEVEVRPLTGWRVLALGGYAAGAVVLMRWILERYPLPDIAVDLSGPWLPFAALLAAPLTLWLAAAASRLLPTRGDKPDLLSL